MTISDDTLRQMKELQSTVASLVSKVKTLEQDNKNLQQENTSLRESIQKKDERINALTQELNKLNNTAQGKGCCLFGYMKRFWKRPSQKQLEDSTIY